jgi:hypothetical protein
MIFSDTNLVSETGTVITASSSHVNFPASNLANPLRSKRWRSSGTFVVDASNNKIDFKESGGGSELTATITSDTYSPTTLAAEIKTQLEAEGSETYTVSFSTTTGLWTIASAGAYLDLLNSTGTNEAASLLKESLGFPDADKTGSLSYTGSTIAIHTKESIVFDFLTTQDIKCVALFWPKEDGMRLSPSAVVKIEANATDTWGSPAVSQTLTPNNDYEAASHFFATAQEYRYWRVTFEDASNPDLYVELGVIWIGENIEFNEPENGFKFGLDDSSKVSKTDFGHQYVDEYPLLTTLSFNYSYITYETAQALENAFRRNGIKKPVLVAFDQSELVFDKDHFLIYGKLDKGFDLNHVNYNLFKGSIKITELG